AVGEVERLVGDAEDVVGGEGFDDAGPDLPACSGHEDAHGRAVYGPLPRDPAPAQGQGSVAEGASVVVVVGGAVVTGAPGTVLGATVVVVDGTVMSWNDEPSTSSRCPAAFGSGTSLASVKYGSSALASSAWSKPYRNSVTGILVFAGLAAVARKPISVNLDTTDAPTLVPVASVTRTFTFDGATVAGWGALLPNVRSCWMTASASADGTKVTFGLLGSGSTGRVSKRMELVSFTLTVRKARMSAFTSLRLSPSSAFTYLSTLSARSTARNGSLRLLEMARPA